MENNKIDLYSIVCEYSEDEKRISESSDEYQKNQRVNHYIHNYENSLTAIGINSELQKELRNGKKHIFENTYHIKSIVALLCRNPKEYNSNIKFKNYSVKNIGDNMSLVLKQDFEHVDINFLSSLYRSIILLINSITDNYITINKVKDTINSATNSVELKRKAFLKIIINENLSYKKLFASDYGLLSEEDKIIYLDLIQFCFKKTFEFTYHLQDYMSANRQDELFENLPDDADDDGPVIYAPNTWIPLYSYRIENLTNKEQNIIKDIYFKEDEKYRNMCEGKTISSRKKFFATIKNEIKNQLKEAYIDTNIIQNLINDLKYCNSTK